MVKLKDFITALAKKAGFDTTTAEAKPFFDALPDTEVPEDIQKGIDTSLISLSEAKNNFPELKNHYQKQSLDGVDKTILELMDDFQVDDQTKAEILAEKSTYKRVPNLARRLVELERKKAATTGGKDKAAIQAEIDGLHAQLKTEKEAHATSKKEFETQRLHDKMLTKLNVLFGGVKTVHDDLDAETRFTILHAQIQKALQDNQAKLVFDDNGNLTVLRNDGTNYFGENHQQVKPAQFIESVLAKNKQLTVTPSGSNGAPQNQKLPQPPGSAGNGKSDQSQSAVIDRNAQALKDYEAATKNGQFNGIPG